MGICLLPAIGFASDLVQLTNFNLLDYLKNHSPQSYYFVIFGMLLLYLVLVIFEFIREKPIQQSHKPEHNSGQSIKTGNVKNSTIIQIKKDNED
jgi:hypothetical protein